MIRHGLTNATSGGRLLLLAARSAAGSSAPTGGTTAAAAASVANWCSSVSAAETFACTTVSFGGGTHLRTGVRSLLQQQLEPLLAFTSRREFSMTALRMYADDTANNFGASRREGSGDGAKPTQRQQPQPQPQPSAPQAAAAAAKQLRAEIKETGSDIKRLLGVIDSRGDCFDDAAVMCAFRQLCEACGPLSRDELEKQVHHHPAFRSLVSMVVMGSERCPPSAISSIVHCLGCNVKLRDDELALDELCLAAVAGVKRMSGKELADLAEGLADAGHSPSIVLLHSINDRLRSLVASPAGAEKQEAPADGGRTPSAAGTTAAEPSRTGGGIGGDVQQRVLAALDKLGFKESAKVPNPPEQQQTARSKEADYV